MFRVAVLSRWHPHESRYTPELLAAPDCQVSCVWDIEEERGRAWAKEIHVPFVKDLEQKALKWMAAQEAEGTPLALGICLGLCLGTVFGTIFNDMGFWIPMGLGLGVCFGVGAGAVMRRPPKSDQ